MNRSGAGRGVGCGCCSAGGGWTGDRGTAGRRDGGIRLGGRVGGVSFRAILERMRYIATANVSGVKIPRFWISARSQILASASSGNLEARKKVAASFPENQYEGS